MNIRKYLLLIPALFVTLFLVRCDEIEGPVREQTTGSVDTTCSFDVDNSPVYKKVLIEDYTGFTCGNCPAAGVYLNDTLHPVYGDSLIVVSVHANFFAIPCGQPGGACPGGRPAGSFETDFRVTAGEDWYDFFNIPTNPLGLIDRAGYPSPSMYQQKTQWAGKIASELAKAPEARLRLKNTYDANTRKLRTCIESKILNAVTDTFKLQLVLIEDSVVDWQLWYSHVPSEFVDDYLHRHVLRTDINGSFGEVIAQGNIAAGTTVVTGYNFTLNPAWDEKHCIVVAFIYDAGNYRILQAEEAHLE
jgi:hypothetical protein